MSKVANYGLIILTIIPSPTESAEAHNKEKERWRRKERKERKKKGKEQKNQVQLTQKQVQSLIHLGQLGLTTTVDT